GESIKRRWKLQSGIWLRCTSPRNLADVVARADNPSRLDLGGTNTQAKEMRSLMVSPRTYLKQLAGEWKGNGTVTMQGQTFPLTAVWKNELVAASYGLRCEIRMIGFPGAEEFIDVEQIGYDDYEQQFHVGTLCTFGETHDLRGIWQSDRLLVQDD